jgi:phosphodiesterase/alkaline phosphatase D-like protein
VLLVQSTANPFSTYYAEILRNEGLNLFDTADLASVTPALLSGYDTVLLGETPLTAAQVTTFVNYVSAGGNLIAMRPDKQLAGLLGLSTTTSTLANGYLLIDTSKSPGLGLVGQTIQFHGAADLYNVSGASVVATLYSTATAATPNPAVTMRLVGVNGGWAAAFTYDLAKSVIYTRQGNPAWDGQERDGLSPIRSNDLFFGPASGDPQPDWIDRTKVAIPQADEQQRLLANLILHLNAQKKPLPRFWYFPKGLKAAVVMTGDDHANGGTAGRFDTYVAASTPGCSVADWECIRGTSYIYPNTPITNAQAAAYEAQGFEIAVHVTTGCGNYTPSSLASAFSGQLALFAGEFPGISTPKTNRTHCIVWSDWSTQAEVSLANGIRLDTNYYWWPASWVNDLPGFMTGSGMAMRFAKKDGTLIDVYQAATQLTDESGQTYPATIHALLDAALGPQGYYGAFVANIHTDYTTGPPQLWSDQIVASAKARGVPVITARQLLTWLDGRNTSGFTNLAWSGNTLTFTASQGSGANGLEALVPASAASGSITAITLGGAPVTYTLKTIKGRTYAAFPAAAGNYAVVYAGAPISISVNPGSVALNEGQSQTFTATVTGTPHAAVTWSISPNLGTISSAGVYTAPASVASATTVTVTATLLFDPAKTASASVVLVPGGSSAAVVRDTTAAEFAQGTGTGFYVSKLEDGELHLAPTHAEEFDGSGIPAGYSTFAWSGGGNVTVAGGVAQVDGARLDGPEFTPGRAMEFVATFTNDAFQHGGFAIDMNGPPWAIFSTGAGGGLFARTHDGAQALETSLPASLLNAAHRFRIEWTSASVRFLVDGAEVAVHAFASPPNLRIVFSDFVPGGAKLNVDWVKVTPFAPSATFVSRVLDGGESIAWGALNWDASVPAGTTLAMRARAGETPTPDSSWSAWNSIGASGGPIGANGRYLQYEASLTTSNPDVTAIVREVSALRAIGAVAATNVTSTSATIAWTTADPRDSQVEYGTTPAYGQTTTLDPALKTTHAVNLVGLSPGTLYYFRVRSRNAGGALAVSPGYTFTTLPPSAPVISGVNFTQLPGVMQITWTTNQPANSRVDYGTSPTSLPFVAANSALTVSHSLLIGGLSPGTYYYRITSCNEALACSSLPLAGEPGAPFTFADIVPPVITGITATPASTSATITWSTNEPATSRVDYGAAPDALTSNVSSAVLTQTHSLTIPSLTAGTVYYFRVTSVDAAANSAVSPPTPGAPLSFTTLTPVPPVVTGLVSLPGVQGVATIRWTTDVASDSRVNYGLTPASLTSTVSDPANVTQHTIRLTGLTQGVRYYYRVVSTNPANGGTVVFPPLADPPASFVENAVSLWNAIPTPGTPLSSDTGAVELGMKFRSSVAGVATGVLFYKGGPANGGTHTGTLWSSAGVALAAVTFTGETASGWQQAAFSAPVPIAANTTYVISYYAPQGRYAIDTNYFNAAFSNAPLQGLANGADGGNGVYLYSSTGGFPAATFSASNYWVDVIFVDNIPPAVSGLNASVSGIIATVSWNTSEPSSSRIDYGTSPTALTSSASSSTPASAHTYTLSGLLATTTYYYRVTATDSFGNVTVFPALSESPLSFTTGVPDTTPPVITFGSATPTTNTATITWSTDEPATSRVDYGTAAGSLTSSVSDPALKTAHSLTLTGLMAGTTYHFRVVSSDASLNVATFPQPPAAPSTFTTVAATPPVITGLTVLPALNGIAMIRWTTNVPANSRVDYGTSPSALNLNVSSTANVTQHALQLTGLTQGATYYFRVTSVDTTTGGAGIQPPLADPPASFRQVARSLWDGLAVPAVASAADTGAVELGMKFQSSAAGVATGVMFYKGPSNTGVHTGKLWTATGTQLATVTFTNETASGWQQALFSTPVAINANTTYVISYFAPNGGYSLNENFFTADVVNTPLRGLSSAASGGNGVFRYGAPGGFPNQTWQASNYWVDVIFLDNIAPTVSGVSATAGGMSAVVSWTSNEATSSRVDYGTSPGALTSQAVNGAFSTANSVTITGLAQNTTYYYRVTATDTSGNVTTFPAPPAAPLSFTTTTGTPPVISSISTVAGTTSAMVTWTTNIPANSLVNYGTSPGTLNFAASSSAFVTNHVVTITGLTPATTYHFRVTSATAIGDAAISPAPPAAPLTFTTPALGGGETGSPPSEWDISGAGDPSIQGFTTDISYNIGETVRFKINTDATNYRLDIYRMGYYNGNGALKVATVMPSVSLPQTQPPCLTDASSGLIDCGNWAESASWTIPATAKSGIYFAKAVRLSGAPGASHIVFVVRNDASTADILFQTSDTTWQAYNQWGGNSLYVGLPAGRAYKVSYNRPFTTRATSPEDWVFNAEYPMVRWLEANGYDVTYTTGVDTDRRGNLLTNHKIFMSVGHDEYWSAAQRTNVENARNAGVHLAFFSANEIFWKTRWENSISSPATPYRTLVSYKETHANAKIDPTPTWTGAWRDPRAFNPEGANPENRLTGTIFTVNCCSYAITVPEADGKMRFWRNTSIATLGAGQTATLPAGTLGYEWDEDLDNGARPPGLIRMSSTTVSVPEKLLDFGSTYGPGTATHALTLYKHASGALVFGSGTIQWPWGLDSNHDRGSEPADVRMQQATVNLLADMGVQPATLQPGLVPAAKSTDTAPPSSIIVSPAAGASITPGSTVTITGTATDTGGVVGGVEVSVDGGATWRRANGRASWTFEWTAPSTTGPVTIMSRATDDSGNIQTPPTSRSVTIGNAAPVISNVAVSVTLNSATVTWNTDQLANRRLNWGTSPTALTSTSALLTTYTTAHSRTASGLAPATTYYFRVVSSNTLNQTTTFPPLTEPPLRFTTAHLPSSVTTVTGTYTSGDAASLVSDDNNWYQVASTSSTTEWYASFTNVPKALTDLRVTYRGSNTASATESVSIWNWAISSWVQLDSRSVSTTEITRSLLPAPINAGDYVSGTGPTGEVRIRIRATRTGDFTSRGELMQIVYIGP